MNLRFTRLAAALVGFAVAALALPMAVFGQTLTVYGTAAGQAGPAYPGGTIVAGDTVRIDNGGSITGAVSNSGTLQFNQTSGSLSLTYTGDATATLSLTSGGTVALVQSSTTTIIDGTVDVQTGRLITGTAAFGSTGTSSLSISGAGTVDTTDVQFASGSGSRAVFTMSSGTFTNVSSFFFASGSASSGTFTMTGGTASMGNDSAGGFAQGASSAAVMNLTGGTCSYRWFEPAKGDNSTATITISGSARLNSTAVIRPSMGSGAVSTLTVNGGEVSGSQLILGSGSNSASTFTVTSGSVGFSGTGITTNGNLIGRGAGSSGTLAFTGGTTTFAGATTVGGIGPNFGEGNSRGMVKVEGGVITTSTAAASLANHFILGRYASTTGEMLVTGGTFTARQDFYVGGSGTGTLTLSGSGGMMQVARLFISSTIASQMNATGGTGAVTVSSGTLLVTGTGAGSNLFVGTNSTGTGSLTINGSGVVIVGGTLSRGAVGAINLQAGGTLQIGTGSTGGVLLGGSGSLVNDGTLVFNRSNALIYSGTISGTGSVVKSGAGTLTLTGTNTYTGSTTVNSGTLNLGVANAISSNTAVTGSAGAVMTLGGSQTIRSLAGAANVVLGAHTLSIGGTTSTSYSGTISGTGSLTKAGAGTLTLSANNTFTGATSITGGGLLVNGASSSGTTTVATAAVLGGSGTISGAVVVEATGTLSPGNSTGILTVNSLSLTGSAFTLIEIAGSGSTAGVAGTDYDQVVVTAADSLSFGGTLDLDFGGRTSLLAQGTTFQLFSFSGTTSGDFTTIRTVDASGTYAGLTFSQSAYVAGEWTTGIIAGSGNQYLVFSENTGRLVALPEPSAVAMAALGAGLAGWQTWRASRRRKRAVTGRLEHRPVTPRSGLSVITSPRRSRRSRPSRSSCRSASRPSRSP